MQSNKSCESHKQRIAKIFINNQISYKIGKKNIWLYNIGIVHFANIKFWHESDFNLTGDALWLGYDQALSSSYVA